MGVAEPAYSLFFGTRRSVNFKTDAGENLGASSVLVFSVAVDGKGGGHCVHHLPCQDGLPRLHSELLQTQMAMSSGESDLLQLQENPVDEIFVNLMKPLLPAPLTCATGETCGSLKLCAT